MRTGLNLYRRLLKKKFAEGIKVVISGFLSESLIDHPGNISFVVYTSPCNFRCPYCHNPSLVKETKASLTSEEVIKEIRQRAGFIDSVTITGGEPTINQGIIEFMREVKKTGVKVKLDTNGHRPDILSSIINENLADYIAMDIKAAPYNYAMATGIKPDLSAIFSSVRIIIDSGIKHEFRTTIVPGIIEIEDIREIGKMVKGAELFILQQFMNKSTLSSYMERIPPYPDWMLGQMSSVMKEFVGEVRIYNLQGRLN